MPSSSNLPGRDSPWLLCPLYDDGGQIVLTLQVGSRNYCAVNKSCSITTDTVFAQSWPHCTITLIQITTPKCCTKVSSPKSQQHWSDSQDKMVVSGIATTQIGT